MAPPASAPATDADVDDIENILSKFQIHQKELERKDREAFDKRNASLWEGIEAAIQQAERRAEEEAQQLANARKKQEKAEAEAREAREAELKQMEEERRAAEAKAQAAQAAAQAAKEEADKDRAQNVYRGGDHIWPAAKKEYQHWQSRMRFVKDDILPAVAGNSDLRKQCFAAKRAITPKIGQLTNSQAELVRIARALATILQDAREADKAQSLPRLYYWCLNHLSKCLIRQAEQEVAARQETAFPLAKLVTSLFMLGFCELGDVLMARLVKKCPWVLGYVPEREDANEETYRTRLGFKYAGESTHSYTSRMTGIAALYFACLETPMVKMASCLGVSQDEITERALRVPEALRPARLWVWQVRAMTPPVSQQPLIVTLWCTFLEVAGPTAAARFRRQAAKLWALLLSEGIQGKKLRDEGDEGQRASLVRLSLLLEKWQATGSLEGQATAGREMDP